MDLTIDTYRTDNKGKVFVLYEGGHAIYESPDRQEVVKYKEAIERHPARRRNDG